MGLREILITEGKPRIVWYVDCTGEIPGYWAVGRDEIGVDLCMRIESLRGYIAELVSTLLHELIHWASESTDESMVRYYEMKLAPIIWEILRRDD